MQQRNDQHIQNTKEKMKHQVFDMFSSRNRNNVEEIFHSCMSNIKTLAPDSFKAVGKSVPNNCVGQFMRNNLKSAKNLVVRGKTSCPELVEHFQIN